MWICMCKLYYIIEGDNENLRQLPDHFSPTSGPAGLMKYLELIFLRFQGLICRISHFCILLSCGDIVRNVKYEIFRNFWFCKKKIVKIRRLKKIVKWHLDNDSDDSGVFIWFILMTLMTLMTLVTLESLYESFWWL